MPGVLGTLGLPSVRRFGVIGRGDAATRATVAHMRRLAREGMVDPVVRSAALHAVAGIDGRDAPGQAGAIREWLLSAIHFTRDPRVAELLNEPRRMLLVIDKVGVGYYDCDDVAILAAALGGAIGLASRFVVVGFLSPKAPFRHVWTELAAPSGPHVGQWCEMDVTRSAQRLPWDAISRRWIVPVA